MYICIYSDLCIERRICVAMQSSTSRIKLQQGVLEKRLIVPIALHFWLFGHSWFSSRQHLWTWSLRKMWVMCSFFERRKGAASIPRPFAHRRCHFWESMRTWRSRQRCSCCQWYSWFLFYLFFFKNLEGRLVCFSLLDFVSTSSWWNNKVHSKEWTNESSAQPA